MMIRITGRIMEDDVIVAYQVRNIANGNAKILTHNEIVQNTALTLLGAESKMLNPDLIGTGTDPYFVFRDCSEDRLPVYTRKGKVVRNKDSLLVLSKIQYQVNKEEVITGYLIASTNGLLKVKESDIFEYYMNYRYNHGETPYLNISIDYGAKVIKSRNLDYPLPCFQEKRIKESTTEIETVETKPVWGETEWSQKCCNQYLQKLLKQFRKYTQFVHHNFGYFGNRKKAWNCIFIEGNNDKAVRKVRKAIKKGYILRNEHIVNFASWLIPLYDDLRRNQASWLIIKKGPPVWNDTANEVNYNSSKLIVSVLSEGTDLTVSEIIDYATTYMFLSAYYLLFYDGQFTVDDHVVESDEYDSSNQQYLLSLMKEMSPFLLSPAFDILRNKFLRLKVEYSKKEPEEKMLPNTDTYIMQRTMIYSKILSFMVTSGIRKTTLQTFDSYKHMLSRIEPLRRAYDCIASDLATVLEDIDTMLSRGKSSDDTLTRIGCNTRNSITESHWYVMDYMQSYVRILQDSKVMPIPVSAINFMSEQGFKTMGYCLHKSEHGQIYGGSLYRSALRYIFNDFFYAPFEKLLKPHIRCFGDFFFSHRLLALILQPIGVVVENRQPLFMYSALNVFALIVIYNKQLALTLIDIIKSLIYVRPDASNRDLNEDTSLYLNYMFDSMQALYEQIDSIRVTLKSKSCVSEEGLLYYKSGARFIESDTVWTIWSRSFNPLRHKQKKTTMQFLSFLLELEALVAGYTEGFEYFKIIPKPEKHEYELKMYADVSYKFPLEKSLAPFFNYRCDTVRSISNMLGKEVYFPNLYYRYADMHRVSLNMLTVL